jgi:hypothetical protein
LHGFIKIWFFFLKRKIFFAPFYIHPRRRTLMLIWRLCAEWHVKRIASTLCSFGWFSIDMKTCLLSINYYFLLVVMLARPPSLHIWSTHTERERKTKKCCFWQVEKSTNNDRTPWRKLFPTTLGRTLVQSTNT